MRTRIKVWEKGDEQMSHGKAAVLAVLLALLGVIGLSLCSGPPGSCKLDCDQPVPMATTLG